MIFVGSYADAGQPSIHAFGFDTDIGALEPRATYTGIANPSFLIVHPQACCLYAVSELSDDGKGRAGSVCAFRFHAESGALEPINQQPSGGDAPCHLAFDASGRWILVSNYNSGTVLVMPIAADGALGESTDRVEHRGAGPPRRQKSPHTHSATFAPDGRVVLVADLGIDQIVGYAFDAAAGRLSANASAYARPGAGPRHLAFHPSQRVLYAANQMDNTISVYDYDATDGWLQMRQSLPTLPAVAPENSVADIQVAPDGKRVYVSNRGHDSIAVFDIVADGALTPAVIQSCGGRGPRHLAIAPTGRFMLVSNQQSGDVAVLPILGDKSCLAEAVGHAPVPGASCVQFVRD